MTSFAIETTDSCCANLSIPTRTNISKQVIELKDTDQQIEQHLLNPEGSYTYYVLNTNAYTQTIAIPDVGNNPKQIYITMASPSLAQVGDKMIFLFNTTNTPNINLNFETTPLTPGMLAAGWNDSTLVYPKNVYVTKAGQPYVTYDYGLKTDVGDIGNPTYVMSDRLALEFTYNANNYWVCSPDNF